MDDIDTMMGRVLDAALAERLFGFQVEQRTNSRTCQREILRRLDNGEWVVVAYYSARLSASLNVGERVNQLGWTVDEASSNRRPDAAGLYRVGLNGPQGLSVSGSGDTWELALGRAAIKAVTNSPRSDA